MEVTVRDPRHTRDVKIHDSELINIKGAIFKVCALHMNPIKIELQPASADQIREFLKKEEEQANIQAPELTGGTNPPTTTPSTDGSGQESGEGTQGVGQDEKTNPLPDGAKVDE